MDTLFRDVVKRANRQSVDIRIAELAHDLRNYYAAKGQSLKTPDAIYLATAIHHRATEFHTFDNQLLSMNGNVGGNRLVICKPETNNPQLDLRKPKTP